MESHPFLHLGVVAIEKGTFGSPTTKVTNFTYFFTYHVMGQYSKDSPHSEEGLSSAVDRFT